jgi:transcriptional regulator with XRE-family HTH domain
MSDRDQVLEEFGAFVSARRTELGLTQTELAKGAGVTQQTVSSLERGGHSPALDRVVAILDALEADLTIARRKVHRGVITMAEKPLPPPPEPPPPAPPPEPPPAPPEPPKVEVRDPNVIGRRRGPGRPKKRVAPHKGE